MSTDIVVRDDSLAPEVIGSAFDLASKVAATEFVPSALRGKPEAIMACILMGREIGVGPMQALSKIHVVDGRPAMAAELMRARALEAGHDLWYEEKTSTRVTVCGRRKGSEHTSKVTWTLDDAKRAGIIGKNNWRKYPRAMLTARATAELCRDLFADCLGGVSYAMEELEDGGFDAVTAEGEPIQGETPKSRARATVPRESPQRAVAPRSDDGPLLPHELDHSDADGEIIDAELVDPKDEGDELESLTKPQLVLRLQKAGLPVSGNKDELIARLRDGNTSGSDDRPEDSKTGSKSSGGDGEAPPAQPGEATDSAPPQEPHDETEPVELPVSDAQRKKLFAVMREHDITDEQRKAVLQHGYDVDSLNDLTKGQVAKLIDGLESSDGATRFKALADGFLADEDDVVDAEIVDEADTPGQPSRSLAERAHAHAKGTSDSIGRYQTRIRRAFAVLAEHRPSPYEGGWDRLEKITDGRAAESDWSGSNESQLRALADDMERAAQEVEDNQ